MWSYRQQGRDATDIFFCETYRFFAGSENVSTLQVIGKNTAMKEKWTDKVKTRLHEFYSLFIVLFRQNSHKTINSKRQNFQGDYFQVLRCAGSITVSGCHH